jgi:hypothetical protein
MRILPLAFAFTLLAQTPPWSEPAEVRYEDQVCVSYRARIDGPYLVVRADVGSGWHTFAMDNEQRAKEKLAGKQPLSIDKSTEIAPAGIELAGPWHQTAPKDLSHPELRWFSWGFDKEATFVAKIARVSGATSQITIRGQACTDKICKNVETTLGVPLPRQIAASASGEINLNSLVAVVPGSN